MEENTAKMYTCFEEMGISPKSLSDSAHLTRDLGLDSLDVTDLVLRLETIFNTSIPDTDWNKFQTIKDIKNYLNQTMLVPA